MRFLSMAKIVFLMTTGVDRPAGRRYLPIAADLVRRGHYVRILALHPDWEHCGERRLMRDGVEIWYVGQMHSRKRGGAAAQFGLLALLRVLLASTCRMIWAIFCSPADIYHLGKPQFINGLAAVIGVCLLRRQGFYVDCDDDEVLSNRLGSRYQRWVFAFWQWVLPRLALGVTVNTRFLLERMRRQGVARAVLVPNGVDTRRFARPPEQQLDVLRSSMGLAGRRIIAYSGSLALQNHPVGLLLDAFALLSDRHPDAALLLIGGGEDLELLKAQVERREIAPRVSFTGPVTHNAVRYLLAMADMSADPIYDDVVARARSPLKLYESIALGVPIVTGDVGDRRAAFEGRGGVIVPAGDAQALAAGLEQLLAQADMWLLCAAQARAHAPSYDWSAMADHWLTVYR